MTNQQKTCTGCKTKKHYSDFSINRTRKDGLQGQCKECNRKANRARRKVVLQANPIRAHRKARRKVDEDLLKTNDNFNASTTSDVSCGIYPRSASEKAGRAAQISPSLHLIAELAICIDPKYFGALNRLTGRKRKASVALDFGSGVGIRG